MSRSSNRESCTAPPAPALQGGGAQRRDPVEAGRGEIGVGAGLGDHAAVADQHHVVEVEALLQLADLGAERSGVGGVALEHLDGHRAAVGGTQQAVDDLQLTLLAIPVVAAPGQFAAAALDIAGGDVVEHQRSARQVPAGHRRLHRRLAFDQPVEGGIELVLVDRAQPQHGAQAGGGGLRVQGSRRGQLRGRRHHTRRDHRDDQVAAAVAGRPEQAIQTDGAQGAEHRRHMPVRQRALHRERGPVLSDISPGPVLGDHRAALEQCPEALDQRRRPVGQVAQGALADLAALAPGFAQQDRWRGFPIGDDFDVHGDSIGQLIPQGNAHAPVYMGTFSRSDPRFPRKLNILTIR
jgi:hypothetical protein